MESINTRANVGLILIVLGLIIFLGNMNIINDDYTLFIIGGGFFLAYLISGKKPLARKLGFLIPSLLIMMIGLFDITDDYISDKLSASVFFFLLATAFILIYILHTRYYNRTMGGRNWPLYTAIVVYAFSIFIYLVEVVDSDFIENFVGNYWPLIIIIIGIYVLFKGLLGDHSKSSKE